MNTQNNKNFSRLIHREYKDSEGNVHTEYKDTQGNIYTEYRDSLGNFHSDKSDKNESINSKLADAHIQDVRIEKSDKNISKGLLIGVIVTTVTALVAGVIFFLNDLNNPQPVSVVNIPPEKTEEKPNPTPPQIKVIEKEVVKIVPVEVPVQTPEANNNKPEAKTNPPTVNNNITVKPSESKQVPDQNSNPKPATVNNNITVKPSESKPAPAQNSNPSATKPVIIPSANSGTTNPTKSDGDLKNEIFKKFQGNLPNHQLKVDVENGAVIVSGNVETEEQIQKIQPLLNSIDGIKKLDVTATVANGVTN